MIPRLTRKSPRATPSPSWFGLLTTCCLGLGQFASDYVQADEPVPVLPGAELRIEGSVAFTEGPVWRPDGNVLFTDIANNRIMRLDPAGRMHVFRVPSGRANGLLLDGQGRLLACEGGGEGGNRRVTRTEPNGTVTVLADRYQEKRFNSPNDLTIDDRGRIYFSDPRYGDDSDLQMFDDEGRRIEGVYRIDPDLTVHRVIAHEAARPNGLGISPDGKWLFVADNVNDGPNDGVGGARRLWRFDRRADGGIDPASRKLLFDWGTDRGPDGMAIDREGKIYVAAGFNFPSPPAETSKTYKAGIYVITPDGRLVGMIPVPEDMITNCAFGGPDLRTLYITAGHKLWSVRVEGNGGD